MQLLPGKKIYFASDFHLGLPMDEEDKTREQLICSFLNECAQDAQHIFLLGDIFDAWFEYKEVIPRGFVRLLGTLANITDAGVKVSIFTGNHDLWMSDFFQKELNIDVFNSPKRLQVGDKTLLIGHGDGLGPGDLKYKLMKKVISHSTAQRIYKLLHPDMGIGLAKYFSRRGVKHLGKEEPFLGKDKEMLVQYAFSKLKQRHYDYFVFGHRHLPLFIELTDRSTYINLGDWIKYNSYAEYDGKDFLLKNY